MREGDMLGETSDHYLEFSSHVMLLQVFYVLCLLIKDEPIFICRVFYAEETGKQQPFLLATT